jgi:hypothetical protein
MMILARIPVRIASIQMAGGACPYQIEATTDDGQFFYLRYRHGRLRAGISPKEEDFIYSSEGYNVIDKQVDPDGVGGSACHDELMPYLDGIVIFPEGFRLETAYHQEEPYDDLPHNSTGSA